MLAAAVVLSGSVAAPVVPAGLVLVVLVPVPDAVELPVPARLPPEPLLLHPHLHLHPLSLRLPRVVVEFEALLHQGCQSFSAAMARSSPPPAQPTYERAPSTRSPPKGRPCPSACLNWMRGRG